MEIDEVILRFLSYQDTSFDNNIKKDIYNRTVSNLSAKKYAKILQESQLNGDFEKIMLVSKRVHDVVLRALNNLYDKFENLTLNPYSYSMTWAIWDVCIQIYFF